MCIRDRIMFAGFFFHARTSNASSKSTVRRSGSQASTLNKSPSVPIQVVGSCGVQPASSRHATVAATEPDTRFQRVAGSCSRASSCSHALRRPCWLASSRLGSK
eukprot:7559594-Pyramimonas_sp.AAC.1